MEPAEVRKITPILFADELERCIQFWTERIGFQKWMGLWIAALMVLLPALGS